MLLGTADREVGAEAAEEIEEMDEPEGAQRNADCSKALRMRFRQNARMLFEWAAVPGRA